MNGSLSKPIQSSPSGTNDQTQIIRFGLIMQRTNFFEKFITLGKVNRTVVFLCEIQNTSSEPFQNVQNGSFVHLPFKEVQLSEMGKPVSFLVLPNLMLSRMLRLLFLEFNWLYQLGILEILILTHLEV